MQRDCVVYYHQQNVIASSVLQQQLYFPNCLALLENIL